MAHFLSALMVQQIFLDLSQLKCFQHLAISKLIYQLSPLSKNLVLTFLCLENLEFFKHTCPTKDFMSLWQQGV